jgi:hypothetical protein
MGGRELQDENLGLNCAWYADILMMLTEDNAGPRGYGSAQEVRSRRGRRRPYLQS